MVRYFYDQSRTEKNVYICLDEMSPVKQKILQLSKAIPKIAPSKLLHSAAKKYQKTPSLMVWHGLLPEEHCLLAGCVLEML